MAKNQILWTVAIHKLNVKLYILVPRRCFECTRFGLGKIQCKIIDGTCEAYVQIYKLTQKRTRREMIF